jgi:thymidylate kinase
LKENNMKKGKFIVIYGINNLGKTTQAKLLVKNLKKNGYKTEYVKYPVYKLEPAGPLINGYLRGGNPHKFTAREVQLLHFIDRVKFEPILEAKLKSGINVVAEDYFGTGVCWGIGGGVNKDLLFHLYKFVKKEDLVFLFDGERFTSSIEKNHRNETNNKLVSIVRKAHLMVGKKYKWQAINANLPKDEIEKIVWDKVKKILK